MSKVKIPSGITGTELKRLRQKHGRLLIVTVEADAIPDFNIEGDELIISDEPTEKKEYVAIFKQPDRDLMSEVTKRAKTDEMKSIDLMFKGCKVAVDEEIINDIGLYLSVAKDLQKLVSQKKTNSQIF